MMNLLHAIRPFAGRGRINVIVETPKGSGSKFKYDPPRGLIFLHRSLPKGVIFPYDYGFIPSTLGDDGDALDALVLVDTEIFTGCLVEVRLIGVILATQEGGKRNDSLIGVHDDSATWNKISDISDLSDNLLNQIEYFFDSHRDFQGKDFKAIGRGG
jgi:inorganic pyrophosphatase